MSGNRKITQSSRVTGCGRLPLFDDVDQIRSALVRLSRRAKPFQPRAANGCAAASTTNFFVRYAPRINPEAPMPFDMDRIRNEWLAGSQLAIAPGDVVAGFNKSEELLGADWIRAHRGGADRNLAGPAVALPIAVTGLQLRSVEGAAGLNEVLARLQARERSARSELAAASYCVEGQAGARLAFGAPVRVGSRNRRPDFRVA